MLGPGHDERRNEGPSLPHPDQGEGGAADRRHLGPVFQENGVRGDQVPR